MRFDIQIEFLNNISDQDIRSSKRIVRDRSKADSLNVIEELRALWKDLILNDVIQLHAFR